MRLHVLAEACIQKITELIFYISTKFARGKLKLENQERRALSSLMLFKYTDPSAEKNPLLFQSRTLSGLSFLYSMQFWGWMIFCMGIEVRLKERFKISVIGVRGNLNRQFMALQRRWLDTVPLKCLWLTPYIPQSGSDHSISLNAVICPNERRRQRNMDWTLHPNMHTSHTVYTKHHVKLVGIIDPNQIHYKSAFI